MTKRIMSIPILALLTIFLFPAGPAHAAALGDVELIMRCSSSLKHTMRYASNDLLTPYGDPDPNRTVTYNSRDVGIAVVGGESHTVVVDQDGSLYHAIRVPNGNWTTFNRVPGADGYGFHSVAVTAVNGDTWVVAANSQGAYVTRRFGATGAWTTPQMFWSAAGTGIIDIAVTWVPGLDVFPFITAGFPAGQLVTGALRGGTLVNGWTMGWGFGNVAADSTPSGSLHLAASKIYYGEIVHQELPRLGQWTGWRDVDSVTSQSLPDAHHALSVAADGLGRVFVTAIGRDSITGAWEPWQATRYTNGYWSYFTNLKYRGAGPLLCDPTLATAAH